MAIPASCFEGPQHIAFGDSDADGLAEILQENHYYPFGMAMTMSSTLAAAPPNNYLYNGKELQDELDLGWYDYGFRFYSPETGRFISVDPLAEEYGQLTTYQYASNDPIVNIDVDGLEGVNVFTGETQVSPTIPNRRPNVAIDPGHGDNHAQNNQVDPGALSPTGEYHEKDLALDISNSVNTRLAEVGVDVTMTRTGDINVDPERRLQWRIDAADNSTIFVSIHINAAENENAGGFVVLYNGEESEKLANYIAENQEIMDLRNGGTHERGGLYVLRNFKNGPSVLVEVGFITNEQDRNTMRDNAPAIGEEIGNGIINYLIEEGIIHFE